MMSYRTFGTEDITDFIEELETLSLNKTKRLLKVSTEYLEMCITALEQMDKMYTLSALFWSAFTWAALSMGGPYYGR